MAKVTVENNDSLTKLVISGELDIYCVSDVYINFLQDFTSTKPLTIDLLGIENSDCAGIQLLIAFFKSLQEKQITYEVIKVSEPVRGLIQLLNVEPWFVEQSI